MNTPVVAVRWPGDQRVDQFRCLRRAPTGEQRLRCIGGQDSGPDPVVQASLAGGLKAGQRHIRGIIESPEPQQSVTFAYIQVQQGGAVPGGLGQCPSPVKDGESLVDLPARERLKSLPWQEAGDQRRGTGRFGDLHRAIKGSAASL